jgi:hypothetical protein
MERKKSKFLTINYLNEQPPLRCNLLSINEI